MNNSPAVLDSVSSSEFSSLRVLVVGTGSIGEKHISTLSCLGASVTVYDVVEEKAKKLAQDYKCASISNAKLSSLLESFETHKAHFHAVIICTPTHTHLLVAQNFLSLDIPLFIEKPITVSLGQALDSFVEQSERRKAPIMVACNLRFHAALESIKSLIDTNALGTIYSVRSYFGHYLPQWRSVDYRTTYSAHASQGGGILLECIHEFDYLLWLFGPVQSVFAVAKTQSDLEINCEDFALVTLKFSSGIVASVQIDSLQKRKRRGLEVIGSQGTFLWESESKLPEQSRIRILTSNDSTGVRTVETASSDSMFIKELSYFLTATVHYTRSITNTLLGDGNSLELNSLKVYNSPFHAREVLILIEAIKESSRESKEVVLNGN